MKPYTPIDLKDLIQKEQYPCISIYLPTHQTGIQVRQDPIRFKNILTQCQNHFEKEMTPPQIAELLKPGFDLVTDEAFWRFQNHGLAIFISPKFFQHFRLPAGPDQKLRIGKYFDILPLIPTMVEDKIYYILVLDQKDIKLLQASSTSIKQIELPNVPKSIDEFLKLDVNAKYLNVHTTSVVTVGGSAAMFNGQGDVEDWRKISSERYLKEIAKNVDKQLNGQTDPLVIAGVDHDQAVFRQNSLYKYILKEGIPSKNGQLVIEKLHDKAANIVRANINKDIEDKMAGYRNVINSKSSSMFLSQILPAASQGQVDMLFVDVKKHVPGKFEALTGQVDIHQKFEEGDEDLLNVAVIYALRNNAKIYPVAAEKLGDPLAAVFRYEF